MIGLGLNRTKRFSLSFFRNVSGLLLQAALNSAKYGIIVMINYESIFFLIQNIVKNKKNWTVVRYFGTEKCLFDNNITLVLMTNRGRMLFPLLSQRTACNIR